MKNKKLEKEEVQQAVEKLLKEIRDLAANGNYIFRGENKINSKVCSNLYRDYENKIDAERFDIEIVQKEMVEQVKKHTHEKNDDNSILEQLQHYGGKTNQIDFSTDYFIALFFSCNGEYEEEGRLIFLEKDKMPLHEPINPQNRVIAQKSVFVRPPKGFVEGWEYQTIVVPRGLKKHVLEYLNKYHNIRTATVYNDIHGYIAQTKIHVSAYTHFFRGFTYHNKRKFLEAIKEYKATINLNPNSSEAHNNLGNCYMHINESELAIKSFDKAIETDKDNVQAYFNRGVWYAIYRLNKLAREDLEAALQLAKKRDDEFRIVRIQKEIDELPDDDSSSA